MFLTDEQVAFRDEVRRFFREALPSNLRNKVRMGRRITTPELREWHYILDDKGWAAPFWDPAWGGTGWDPVRLHIFREEMQLNFAPPPLTMNLNLAGPTIIAFGNDEQKKKFLRSIRRLDYYFCQGFSEPNSGSDLASLRTRAERDGDHYVINGQKCWTTLAHEANWMFALVRTDPNAKKHLGITYLLIDMNTPGITVRPVITIDHDHHVNEVFFDNVRVPVANRIGEENQAWNYAKFLLTNERVGGARTAIPKSRILLAKEIAATLMVDGKPLGEQEHFREQVASIEVELKALEMTYMRVLTRLAKNPAGKPDPLSSLLKLRGSELMQRTSELFMDMAGMAGLPYLPDVLFSNTDNTGVGPAWAATAAQTYFADRATTIFAGSSEIQHNIIAKEVLGL